MEKKCTKCGEVKSLDEFSNYARSKDGKKPRCRACSKLDYQKRWLSSQQDYHVKRYYRVTHSRSETRKTCTKCGEQKDVCEFIKRPRNNSGRGSICKTCSNKYHKQNKLDKYGKQTTPYTESWRAANRDKVSAMQKKADKKRYNEPKRVAQRNNGSRKRRARKAGVESENWLRLDIHSEARGRCIYCGIKVTLEEMEADHFIPLAKGGSNLRDNIVCSCRQCNRIKSDKMPEDFIGRTL